MNAGFSPLKSYRRRNGLTQTALGKHFGKVGSTIMRWERGLVPVPPEKVLEIERLTGISRYDLRPDIYGPPLSTNTAG